MEGKGREEEGESREGEGSGPTNIFA